MIEIVKPYSHLPGDLYVNGKYWLDMAVDAVRLSEKIDNFLIDKIDVPAAIGLTFPRTMRNRLALEPFINGQSGQFAGRACKVVAYLGDVTLPFSDLFIISSTEKEYSGELRLGDDYWLIKAELLKLNAIPFDLIRFLKANIDTSNSVPAFVDGGDPVRYPHVNWGNLTNNLNTNRTIINEMFSWQMRPFISVLDILRKGFAWCGMALSTPVFESDWGRRLIAYLLRNDYGVGKDALKLRGTNVSNNTVSDLLTIRRESTLTLPMTVVSSGTFVGIAPEVVEENRYTNFYYYSRGEFSDIRGAAKILVYVSENQYLTFRLNITLVNPAVYPNPINIASSEIYIQQSVNTSHTYDLSVEIDNAEIPPYSQIFLTLTVIPETTCQMIVQKGTNLLVTPNRVIYSEGDQINLAEEIDPNLSFLDFLKGMIHLIDGKLYYARGSAKIYLMPTNSTIMFDDSEVEGFYTDDVIDITEQVVPGSMNRHHDKTIVSNNVRVGYASSTDDDFKVNITDDKDYQLFDGYSIVNPGGYQSEVISRNPLFLPTLNKQVVFFNTPNDPDPAARRAPNDLPYISDNDTGKASYNVGARILYFWGNTPTRRKMPDDTLMIPGMSYYGDVYAYYAFDLANLVNVDGSDIKECLIYGNREAPLLDLYQLFWLPSLRFFKDSIEHQVLAYMIGDISFRDIVTFHYQGHQYVMRLTAIDDWDGGITGLSTPITLVPTIGSLEPPDPDYDVPLDPRSDCDYGSLALEVSYDSGTNCYTALITGSSSMAISSIDYYYKYIDDTSFTSGDTLCDPSGSFIFMAVVHFDAACADLSFNEIVNPCNNTPSLIMTYNDITKCLTITVDDTNVHSTVDTDTITYSINGGADTPYTGSICSLTGDEVITAHLVQTYIGGCASTTADAEIQLAIAPVDCSLNTPGLTYTTISDCKILPDRTGDLVDDIVIYDHIYYRYSDSDEWQLWDENTPIDTPVHLRRVVEFTECDPAIVELYVT